MTYRLGSPPQDAPRWVIAEFQKIEQAWRSAVPYVLLDTLYVAPAKPRPGMTVQADGTSWNPGSGAGPYTYTSGAWAALIGGGGGGVTDGDKGDITVSGGGTAWAIDPGAVTLAKQADIATSRLMGRVTAGAGVQEALTGTQATTLIDTFTAGLKGSVPASGGGTANYLRADGTWTAPGGITWTSAEVDFGAGWSDDGEFTITDAGITAASSMLLSVSGSATTVDNDAATHAIASSVFEFGYTPAAGSASVRIRPTFGACTGKFSIRYAAM